MNMIPCNKCGEDFRYCGCPKEKENISNLFTRQEVENLIHKAFTHAYYDHRKGKGVEVSANQFIASYVKK